MVIDKRGFTEHLEIYFDTEGKLSDEEMKSILENIRIVIEQRQKTKGLTIIRL